MDTLRLITRASTTRMSACIWAARITPAGNRANAALDGRVDATKAHTERPAEHRHLDRQRVRHVPTVDQVQINLRADLAASEQEEAVLQVNLEHSMPILDRLLVRIDHETWHETEPDFTGRLKPGKNEIMAKGANAFGREGHISRILLRTHF